MLDEYWPVTTIIDTLKQTPDKRVYSASYNNSEVIVKSVPYEEDLFQTTEDYEFWINYMGETLEVASYILPGVVESDDGALMVTMSKFAQGVCPECALDCEWTWITDEDAVKAQGEFFGDFRRRSMQFAIDYPEEYAGFPSWDTIQGGW